MSCTREHLALPVWWHPLDQLFTSQGKVEFTRVRRWCLRVFEKLRLSDQVQLIAWHGI